MTSLLAWWFGTGASSPNDSPSTPSSPKSRISPVEPAVTVSISTPEETERVLERDEHMDDDMPPAFPSLNSIQRSSASRTTTARLMPPPALPASLGLSSGGALASSRGSTSQAEEFVLPLPTSDAALQVPLPSPHGLRATPTLPPTRTKKRKVALAPGHSLLDWAALKTSGQDLRGTPALMRITPSELRSHNKREDAWSAFNGKVYNITPYLSYHPGGEKELMRAAGRDGTQLFARTHAWVNVDFMLDECLVGFLISEPSSAA